MIRIDETYRNINKSQSFKIIENPITETIQKIMQTFQMDNQKAYISKYKNQSTQREAQKIAKKFNYSSYKSFKYQPRKGSQWFRFLKIENSFASPYKLVYINSQQPININLAISWMFSFTVHHQNTIMCIPFL